MTLFRRLVLLVAAVLCLSSTALAADVKTYAVAPFAIHGPEKYQYLSQGAQSMLESRMNWPGHLAPVDKGKVTARLAKAPASEAEARKALADIGADFLAYGSLTVSGEQASVDITVLGRDGKKWPKNFTAKLADLIPAMERAAQSLNNEIFQRPAAPGAAQGAGGQSINQMNPDFVVNQTSENQKVYLNPSFRYAGPSDTPGVWRSQSMPIVSGGIAIDDLNGDGKNEVVIMTKDSIETYVYKDRQLLPIARYQVSPNLKLLKVSTLDINGDGKAEIIVSASYFKEPRSFILSLEGNQIKELYKDIKLYMNVAAVPPDFTRQLVGSKGEPKELFVQGVHNVIFSGGQPALSTRLNLPSKANPFNFVYLPEKSGYKVVLNDDRDHLVVYTAKGERVAATEEEYCGSAIGLEFDPLMAPMEKPKTDHLWTYYYIPLPMIVANLDKDDRSELLVSKNISLAAQFFETFRTFSQGEIHSLYWDGVGMNLLWKTRRIKGTITGYALSDIDNDGQKELVVCLNTWPGAVGVYARRTIVLAYKLDTSSMGQPGEFGIDQGTE
ncbi:MAG: VCBS repeat-containing protein [Solidesulfovibrio sp.]|uniref:VCBS repeat-containing protein n=1 Tax=Solidesulfovibrio sp. TaxID=2910990 RepID=UPI002B221649|nr:VCBS repeat-containing protein [Solidesulfovibrio sp.]MEA4856271.1 VCBS repeat-containing protein [Solidesulfovibrio sp.]